LLDARPELLLALLGRSLGGGERIAAQQADITQAIPIERRAALRAAVHGGHATLAAVAQLDQERRECYVDLLTAALGKVARVAMESFMSIRNPFEGATQRAFDRHYRKLERQEREAGRAEGIEVGRGQGLETGQRNAILTIMAERGLGPSEESRARIEAETDLGVLERWMRRAVTATDEAAVFA
jgi:hypothetical protein